MNEDTNALPRLLIVDDSRMVRASIIKQIRDRFDCREECDGEAAWEALVVDSTVQVLITDIGMPRLDGYEACRRIRQRAWGRNVPIYAITGWGQPSDRRRTREAGFNAHLVKPVSIEAINGLIAQTCGRE